MRVTCQIVIVASSGGGSSAEWLQGGRQSREILGEQRRIFPCAPRSIYCMPARNASAATLTSPHGRHGRSPQIPARRERRDACSRAFFAFSWIWMRRPRALGEFLPAEEAGSRFHIFPACPRRRRKIQCLSCVPMTSAQSRPKTFKQMSGIEIAQQRRKKRTS